MEDFKLKLPSKESILGRFQAVFFDFDETLVHAHPPVFEGFLRACAQLELHFDPETARHGQRFLYRYFAGSQAQSDYAHFGSDLDRFYVHVTTRLLVEMGTDGRAAEIAVRVGELSVRLPKGVRRGPTAQHVLNALKARGLRLGVVSNNGDDIAARCRELGFDEQLDFVITRIDAGCTKPDPHIFELALERAGVEANATVFVGDNYYADALGAQNMGMVPVLLDPEDLFPEADCAVIQRLEQLLALVR